MTEHSSFGQHNMQPTAAELPLIPAEQLDPAFVAGYYVAERRRSTEWNRTLDAWGLLEATLADASPITYPEPLKQAFGTALQGEGTPRNPATETYRFDVTGQAFLPLFIGRHALLEPLAEERMETYGMLGDGTAYVLGYGDTPDFGALAEFIGFSMFVRPGSPGVLFPGSPREALGHDTDKNHDGYRWFPSGEKIPVEIKHMKRKSPGVDPSISMLRIGHKIQEAIADRPLRLQDHDRLRVEHDTVHIAKLLVMESRSETIPLEDLELLGRFGQLLYDKIDQDRLIVRPPEPDL